jgi:L-alanine-DL-glutamate epimerase-like enolase superfamily enzyme
MKITGFRTETFNYSRGRKIGDANGSAPSDTATGSLLFIETDAGVTGVSMGGGGAVGRIFRVIEGQDPRGVTGLWKEMNDFVFKTGNEGQDFRAISAIDAALWDLKAKAAGEPLWRMLGASVPRVKAYASGLDMPLTDDELAAFYQSYADLGVDAGKLKVGLDIDADLRRLAIVRDILAKNARRPHLMIDSNEYWSPKQAIRYISMIEDEFDLTWAEEPARRWDYRGLRKVSQGIKTAVATGENINGLDEYYPLIHNEAVDVVQFGSGAGITVPMQIAHFAMAYELPVSVIGAPGNLVAHAAAAMPNHIMQEVKDLVPPPCVTVDNHIEDGFIVLGNEPGSGLKVDEKKLKELQGRSDAAKSPFVPKARRRGAGLIVVPPEPGEGIFGV